MSHDPLWKGNATALRDVAHILAESYHHLLQSPLARTDAPWFRFGRMVVWMHKAGAFDRPTTQDLAEELHRNALRDLGGSPDAIALGAWNETVGFFAAQYNVSIPSTPDAEGECPEKRWLPAYHAVVYGLRELAEVWDEAEMEDDWTTTKNGDQYDT